MLNDKGQIVILQINQPQVLMWFQPAYQMKPLRFLPRFATEPARKCQALFVL